MSFSKITIPAQGSFLEFNITLNNVNYRFQLQWSLGGGYFRVNIYDRDTLLSGGQGLHPEMDLFRYIDNGSLKLVGAQPTPENIGIDNHLVYEI